MNKFTVPVIAKKQLNINLNGSISKRRRLQNGYDENFNLIKNGLGYKLFLQYNNSIIKWKKMYGCIKILSSITKAFDDTKLSSNPFSLKSAH